MRDREKQFNIISFSEVYTYYKCQHKYNMVYNGLLTENNSKIFPRSETNLNLSLGQLFHRSIQSALEKNDLLIYEEALEQLNRQEKQMMFENYSKIRYNNNILKVCNVILEYCSKNNYKFISSEYKIDTDMAPEIFYKPTSLTKFNRFSGSIDLILKQPDDNILIIDIKTGGFKYIKDLKQVPQLQYQIVLYKNFYHIQNGKNLNNINQGYFLINKQSGNYFEHLRLTSGPKRIENAMNWVSDFMNKATNSQSLLYKNRLSCNYCELEGTIFCTGKNNFQMENFKKCQEV